jgi:amidase
MAQSIGPYSTATEMLGALRARTISSLELVELHLQRIEQRDGALNAIPVRTADRARDAARAADTALARGQRAALLGLPMTLKESTQTAGLPQSAGMPQFKDHEPAVDGTLAKAVFAAGACLLGKTNIPVALGDWQADSPIYGRTNNPWDLRRTPGGSTGGGGAALAAGMDAARNRQRHRRLDSGSGCLLRRVWTPAVRNGDSARRFVPDGGLAEPGGLMGVQGPLARSATDLELLFDVIAGPCIGEDAAWKLALPESRGARLKDFRVAVMPPMPWVKAASEMQGKVDELAHFLSQRGAKVAQGMPNLDFEQYFRDYLCLLTVITSQGRSRAEREATAAGSAAPARFPHRRTGSFWMRPVSSRWCTAANRRAPRGVRSLKTGTC